MRFLKYFFIFLCLVFIAACATQKKKPVVKKKPKAVAAAPQVPYTTYKVIKGETIASIAKKEKVTPQDIVKMNPGLKDPIAVGSMLKIPYQEPVEEKKEVEKQDVFKVALLLPLNLDKNLISEEEEEVSDKNSKVLAPVEFYQGVLLALDSLKSQGLNAKVKVYDFDSTKYSSILSEIKDVEMIIGPFSNNQLRLVSDFASQNSIPLISPLTTVPNNFMNNPYLVLAVPSVNTQCRQMANFVASSFGRDNILIVSQGNKKETELSGLFKNIIRQKSGTESKVLIGTKDALAQLSSEKRNVIIVPSSSEAFVTQFVNMLNLKKDKYNITLIGLPTWEDFETLDFQVLENFNTHLFKAVNINSTDPQVKNFQKKYLNEYKGYPTNYSYQGFGVMYYYGNSYLNNNNNNKFFPASIGNEQEVFHTKYQFEKSPSGALENQYIHIFKVKNFELQKVN